MSIIKVRAALEVALDAIAGIIPAVAIATSASGTPAIFTTSAPHLLVNNVSVGITGHSGSTPSLNGSYLVVVLSATTFSLLHPVTKVAIASTVGGTGGVVTAKLTAWEGVAFATVPLVPYQRVNLLSSPPENPSFGGSFYRELGFMQVTLYYPVQRGVLDIMTRAELLRTTFARGASFTSSGVTVNIPKKASISAPKIDEEVISSYVRIPYWADIFS